MNIGEKIRNARKIKQLTQEQLGSMIGVKKSAIAKYESGRVVNIKRSTIKLLAEILDLDPSELIFDDRNVEKSETFRIPIVGDVCAGNGVLAEENRIEWTGINESMAKKGVHFALQIKGDSMEPDIPDGSIVIVRCQQKIDNGDVVIVLLKENNEGVCKIAYKGKGKLVLRSINEDYAPITLTSDEEFAIIGKVVECRTEVDRYAKP